MEVMDRNAKTKLIVLTILAVLIGIIVLILGLFQKPEVEHIVLPKGGLSKSLFDSQNSKYTASEAFPNQYMCTNIPYTIDTVATDGALVDTGIVYPTESGYYFFYSEVSKTESTSNCVGRQFAKVLNFDFDPSKVLVETMATESGFLNGFGTEYQVVHIKVPGMDGKEKDAYLTTYRFILDTSEQYDLILGVATGVLSNDTLVQAKALLDANAITVQFNEKLNRELIEAAEKQLRAEQEEAEKAQKEAEKAQKASKDSVNTALADTSQNASNTALSPVTDQDEQDKKKPQYDSTGTAVGDTKSMGILLKKDYDNLVIKINWTNKTTAPSQITISDAAGTNTYRPDAVADGQATFRLGAANAGVYLVMITGWESCGTFTSELLH